MNNLTTEIPIKKNIFHQYLLGQSLKNCFIRFLFILLIILLIWFCMIMYIIIYLKYRQRKYIGHIFLFNQNSKCKSYQSEIILSKLQRDPVFYSYRLQKTIEAMSRQPNTIKKTYLQDSFTDDQYMHELQTSNVDRYPSSIQYSSAVVPRKQVLYFNHLTTSNLPHLHQTRSLILPPTGQNFLSNQRRYRLSNNCSYTENDLPLVMITDTNSSHTNIVELETFEDKTRFLSDIEKNIKQQLKTIYRPRYST